ncbi:MAG: tyrosine-type recombinase/integrase [Bacteroidia bacterium]|nr:tyrosine-type recombinase/integrase [Bacteroidia bacterium]
MKQEQIYLQQFKEYFIIKGYSSKSIQSISTTINYFLNWIEIENILIEEITNNDILAYIQYKRKAGNKPKTLQLIIIHLNHFFNFLIADSSSFGGGWEGADNPASNVKIQGVKRKTLQEILTPVELENIYKSYTTEIKPVAGRTCPPQVNNELARKRNKVILGLIIYQGIRTEELASLELQDLQLREGKINIQAGKRTAGRLLKLESHQVYNLIDYVNVIRKQILEATNKQSNKVFISVGTSLNFANIMQKLTKSIQENNKKVKDIKQIRASVITNWLKVHNLRKTQYMAGHRYVSSTESYQVNNIDALVEDITKYHPIN